MNFKVTRYLKGEFYNTFAIWCGLQNFQPVPFDALPENVFVCSRDGIDIYCVWLYESDSAMAILAFPCSDRSIGFEFKDGGLSYLFERAAEYAKEKHYKMIFTTSGTKSVIKSLKETGYVDGDIAVNQYFKTL